MTNGLAGGDLGGHVRAWNPWNTPPR